MRYRPVKNLVFVRPTRRPTETKSGLSIVEAPWTPEFTGVVTAIGPKVRDLKVSDLVIFGMNNGLETTLEHQPHLVMRETDVLAVLEV